MVLKAKGIDIDGNMMGGEENEETQDEMFGSFVDQSHSEAIIETKETADVLPVAESHEDEGVELSDQGHQNSVAGVNTSEDGVNENIEAICDRTIVTGNERSDSIEKNPQQMDEYTPTSEGEHLEDEVQGNKKNEEKDTDEKNNAEEEIDSNKENERPNIPKVKRNTSNKQPKTRKRLKKAASSPPRATRRSSRKKNKHT